VSASLPPRADSEVRFPDDHPDESRRGQSRRVRVTLHEVKRQELPTLDDAFAREVGDFEDLAALRAAVRQDLEREAAREADAQVRQALLSQVIEANQVPAPESLVHRLMHGYADMYRIPQEQLGQFEQQFHPVAETQVRRDLALYGVPRPPRQRQRGRPRKYGPRMTRQRVEALPLHLTIDDTGAEPALAGRRFVLHMVGSDRLGLVHSDDPIKVEAALCGLYPKKKWTLASDTFILHGRRICKPKPQCRICNARRMCDYALR